LLDDHDDDDDDDAIIDGPDVMITVAIFC